MAALAISAATSVHATPPSVTNCTDHGSGSLRAAVQGAVSGDTIDLSQLQCSLITLTTGRIDVPGATIQGPGSTHLTIDGNLGDRVFNHAGNDILTLNGLTLTRGANDLTGGCVYATGTVILHDTTITACELRNIAGTGFYKGGGITVHGDLFMYSSTISNNILSTDLGHAFGGGAYAYGDMVVTATTISGNRASSASAHGLVGGGGAYSFHSMQLHGSTITGNTAEGVGASSSVHGGGVYALGALVAKYDTFGGNRATSPHSSGGGGATTFGRAYMEWTTVSGNEAGSAGGLELFGGNTPLPSLLFDSTISGNHATTGSGGGILGDAALSLRNCTIAFNTEQVPAGAGLLASEYAIDLQGTLIAGNTAASAPLDVGGRNGGTIAASSSHSLVVSSSLPLPPGTLQGDPLLDPLRDNGGHTYTHALRAGSPAINHGNNAHNGGVDQRGIGFPRVIGSDADIGAFEFNPDVIFVNGFN
ncbi:MAG: choice-of-anchor Q domain-containing protein [Dokdonella sp.]